MSTIVIAEKPSLARAIQAAVGGQGYTILAAQGHLMELAPLDDYLPEDIPRNPKGGKQWRKEDLPIIPGTWKRVASKGGGQPERFKKIMQAMKTATTVINAGDPDREGQLLVDELIEHAGFKGKVLRAWLQDLDADSIRHEFRNNLKPNSEFRGLSMSADARGKGDWIVGMNLTRAWTLENGLLTSIGRVQTPVLGLIVARDREIENFVPHDFFRLYARIQSKEHPEFKARWIPSDADKETPDFDEEGRLINEQKAQIIMMAIRDKPVTLISFQNRTKKQKAPLPFSLSALQRKASSLGLSAQQTLDIAQKLYDQAIISYPRSDCRYLNESGLAKAKDILGKLPLRDDIKSMVDPSLKHSAWNDSKVGAHTGIIPTGQPGPTSGAEGQLYQLIMDSYVALFLPSVEIDERVACLEINRHRFEAKSETISKPGWKALLKDQPTGSDDAEDLTSLPLLDKRHELHCPGGDIQSKKTTPPARFNDGTLVSAMGSVHRIITDPEQRARLKETDGIGTEATRASIIETLVKRSYVERKGKGKSGYLISTERGRSLIDALDEALYDPATTAQWEGVLSQIADGHIDQYGPFLKQLSDWTIEQLGKVKTIAGSKPRQELPTMPCPSEGCSGTIKRFQGKKNKKAHYWICTEDHPPFSDVNGKPGTRFDEEDENAPPCPVPGCTGTVKRLQSKAKKGKKRSFFWVCSSRNHPPMGDNNGQPGECFPER